MPTKSKLPEDVIERVRSSQLLVMLAINMMAAADYALGAGRLDVACTKYCRATHYFRASVRIYAHDEEMRAWVEGRLRACAEKSQILFGANRRSSGVHPRGACNDDMVLGVGASAAAAA
eukprot:scaffold301520_cov37-Tisochrysis_lutea.AAC.1